MSSWWKLYQSKSSQKGSNASIAKDDAFLLAERLEFFSPNFKRVSSTFETIIYIVVWSLFITTIQLSSIATWQGFLAVFSIQTLVLFLTVIPSIYLIGLQEETLKELSVLQACSRIVALTVFMGAFSILFVLFTLSFIGFLSISAVDILIKTALYALSIAGFTIVILIYALKRYAQLKALQTLFEQRLKTQNNHIKARLAPHFFFNTINTLAFLVETDANNASRLLQHLSHLFRSSFSEPKESNFEEELELCQHYLAIEHYRLQDKLIVKWDLPDEDLIYDMSITSLTLQNVLEQTVLHVVEMTTDSVHVNIKVSWENHTVVIIVSTEMPKNMFVVRHNIRSRLNFSIQEGRLQSHFGPLARITTIVDYNKVTNTIHYPLHDALT